MASGDLTITLSRVGSFRAERHGDYDAQTSHVLDCSGGDRLRDRLAGQRQWRAVLLRVCAGAPPATYQGPGDIAAFQNWYSCAFANNALLIPVQAAHHNERMSPTGTE